MKMGQTVSRNPGQVLELERKNLVPRSAYVHIPFCRRRCFYCDFPISVVGDRKSGENSGMVQQYVEKLCQEIRQTASRGSVLETVFFGGGTPSLLAVEQLDQILDTLDRVFGITSGAELSIEMDPGTFDQTKLQGFLAAGITRVSLGVQAFQPELLQVCGRTHTVEEVDASIKWIQKLGLINYSLDLISGLPTQTLAQWQESLDRAIGLEPTHISTYDLTLEPGTVFGKRYEPGDRPLPTDEMTAQMYRLASERLRSAGYEHYEISNYAKPGYQCRHNRTYWENRPFYGFGMGATSYLEGDRLARPRTRDAYYAWLEAGGNSGSAELPSDRERLLDTLMVGLRLAEGLEIEALVREFGRLEIDRVWGCLQRYVGQGWVVVRDRMGRAIDDPTELPEAGWLSLSEPEGFLFSNVVLVELFEKLGS